MEHRPVRLIIDTNLWISFLISGNTRLDDLLFSGKAILIFSVELLSEFISVASREKFKRFFSPDDLAAVLGTINDYAIFKEVKSEIKLCRDPKDDFLLALAIDSNADLLVTGDLDLLEMEIIGRTRIITMTEVLKAIN